MELISNRKTLLLIIGDMYFFMLVYFVKLFEIAEILLNGWKAHHRNLLRLFCLFFFVYQRHLDSIVLLNVIRTAKTRKSCKEGIVIRRVS